MFPCGHDPDGFDPGVEEDRQHEASLSEETRVESAIRRAGGRLDRVRLPFAIAVRFGHTTGADGPLRHGSAGDITDDVLYGSAELEPHVRGRVLTATVRHILNAYPHQIDRYLRMATGGSGALPEGDITLEQQALRCARRLISRGDAIDHVQYFLFADGRVAGARLSDLPAPDIANGQPLSTAAASWQYLVRKFLREACMELSAVVNVAEVWVSTGAGKTPADSDTRSEHLMIACVTPFQGRLSCTRFAAIPISSILGRAHLAHRNPCHSLTRYCCAASSRDRAVARRNWRATCLSLASDLSPVGL